MAFGQSADTDAPVQVEADSLKVNQTTGEATFTGNVVIGQGEMRLSAAEVTVVYAAGGNERISSLRATGGVTLVNGPDAAEASEAAYDVEAGTVALSGDVVLTPNWCWHGHGNESRACGYWLDVLDVPLVHLLEPMFFEPHPDDFEKESVVPNASPMHFPWAQSQARLAEAAAKSNGHAAEIALDAALDTMALSMIELKGGQSTKGRKVMANSVFGVVQGSGTTEVEGSKLAWNRGDVIVVPSWREHTHRSDGGAVLFRVTDEPVMRKLGFLREAGGAH